MEVLLEVGGFDMDGSVEMTMTQVNINVQKRYFGGADVSSELDGIAPVETFKELGKLYSFSYSIGTQERHQECRKTEKTVM